MQFVQPAPSITHGLRHQDFLGLPITGASLAETITVADEAMRNRQPIRYVSINVAKFVAMRTNTALDDDVRSSDIVGVDGMGILWAARVLGIKLQERVAGIDLMDALLDLCAKKRFRPYILGARSDILATAVANIQKSYPSIEFAGWRDGYFSAGDEPGIVEQIRSSRPDCLFVGMPTPKKEHFVARHRSQLEVPFIMGVGGSLDVFAGDVHRAPRLVQHFGLEWMFRTIQEPRRLGPRYVKTNLAFAAIMGKALIAKYATRN